MDNCHAKWLRTMVIPMRAEGHTAWANTCEQAADEIDALQSHRDNRPLQGRQFGTPSQHYPMKRSEGSIDE
jgi:hypothetical protein